MLEKSSKGKGRRCRAYLLRPDEVRAEEAVREEPRGTPESHPKGHVVSEPDAAQAGWPWACSHVNSYGRPMLGGALPYQLASQVLPEELFDGLGIECIAPEEVVMKPGLVVL